MKYLALALAGTALAAAPVLAQQSAPTTPDSSQASASTAAPAKPNVTAGAQVSDLQGGAVGTIESVSSAGALISTGSAKATLPLTAFAQGPNGLIIGMTKTELEAAIAKATGGAQTAGAAGGGAPAASQTASAQPASITVGATVSDPKGGKVGTVEAVSGDLVTVATTNAKAQLPKSAFAQGSNGLVIAMTASELEAAAKAAGAPRKSGS